MMGRHRLTTDSALPALRAMFEGAATRMAWGAVLAAVTVLAGMGLLGLSGWFITATAIAGLNPTTALAFDVFAPSAGIRLLALGRTTSRYGERLLTHDATLAALARLREQIFRGWAQADDIQELVRRPARALFRLTSDLDALDALYLRLLVPMAAALGATVLAVIVVGVMSPWLGISLGVWMLVPGIGLALMLARRSRRPATRRALLTERLRAQAIDLVSGQTALVMAGRLDAQRKLLGRTDQRLARQDRQLQRLDSRMAAIHGVVGSLTLALVLLGVGILVEQQQISMPGAVLALLIALSAMEPFAALRRGALESGRTWLAARRISRHCADGTRAARPAAPAAPEGALVLKDVSARHPDSPGDALTALSLTLKAGERVAVVGPSGAGKSTLLALVAGERQAHAGEVLAMPCAWLNQRPDLFQDSLRDNLLLAAPKTPDERLWQVLDAAGLESTIKGLQAGLDTQLGEGGLGLSAGQIRRLALARLLLQSRPLWLLDEPTEGLDAATASDVLSRLDALGAGRAWLMATHLRREAELADRLLLLRNGRIADEFTRGSDGFAATLAALRPD